MTKQTGLGDAFYYHGRDLSGDTQAFNGIGGGNSPLEMTGIDKLAFERQGGKRDGRLPLTSFFNDDPGQAHPVYSALPTTDVILTYCRGVALGSPAFCLNAKQVNYDGTRGEDGSLLFNVESLGNQFGGEWGVQLAAKQTVTVDGGLTSIDDGAATTFGAQAYLQLFDVTGTGVTIEVEDSADNAAFANIMTFSGGEISGASDPIAYRATKTGNVRRYTRVKVTGDVLTSVTFAVIFMRNATAVSF